MFDALKPGAFLGLSHGFLLGYLNNIGKAFPKNIDVRTPGLQKVALSG